MEEDQTGSPVFSPTAEQRKSISDFVEMVLSSKPPAQTQQQQEHTSSVSVSMSPSRESVVKTNSNKQFIRIVVIRDVKETTQCRSSSDSAASKSGANSPSTTSPTAATSSSPLLLDSSEIKDYEDLIQCLSNHLLSPGGSSSEYIQSLTFQDDDGETYSLDDDDSLDIFKSSNGGEGLKLNVAIGLNAIQSNNNSLTGNNVVVDLRSASISTEGVLVPPINITPATAMMTTRTNANNNISNLSDRELDDDNISHTTSSVTVPTVLPHFTSIASIPQKCKIFGCSITADGAKVVTGGDDGTVRIFSLRNYQKLFSLKGHKSRVLSCDTSPVVEMLTSSSADGTVRLWTTIDGGKKVITFRGHTDKVYRARFTPHGDYVLTASCDGTARVWKCPLLGGGTSSSLTSSPQPQPQHCVRQFRVSSSFVTGPSTHVYDIVSVDKKGSTALASTSDGHVAHLSVEVGVTLGIHRVHHQAIWGLSVSPDESSVATASMDGQIKLWSIHETREIGTVGAHSAAVHSAFFMENDSRYLLSCGKDGVVLLWDVRKMDSGKPLVSMPVCNGAVHCLHEKKGQLVASCNEPTVKIWKRV
eukprot:PhF_6_TR24766/c0_g1_i2/m.33986